MSTETHTVMLTPAQLDFVLCDIASTAKVIDRLSVLLRHVDDARDSDAFHIAIECLAQRIGWAADMAMERSSESIGPCYGGQAEQWMMPPAFHRAPAPRP